MTEDAAQAAAQQQAAQTQQAESQQQEAAPWGDDAEFDAEKAKKLIANLRGENTKLKNRPVLDDDSRRKLTEYDKLVESQKTEAQKLADETARWQSEAEKWRSASVASTVKAFAATDFADPDDAVRNLDPSKYLDAGGVIDEKAIQSDLAALLEAKPHYRRAEGQQAPRTPRPNAAQGSGVNGKAAADPAQEFAAILQGAMK
jgi:hypothetical protein